MSLNNDTIQQPLPGNLQARIENAQNLVTTLEAEKERLMKYIANQKSEINSNHAELQFILERTNASKAEYEKYQLQLQEANALLVEIHGKIEEAKKELDKAAAIKAETIETILTKNVELAAREDALKNAEEDFAARRDAFLIKEAEHEVRVERLKKAID